MTRELLENLVIEAGKLALAMQPHLEVELKPDGSVVTNVDREIETWIRKKLAELAPNENIWGEEFGNKDSNHGNLWLIDPIDGTTNFSKQNPIWGVSIARMDAEGLQLGAISIPSLNITMSAERGKGAFWNSLPMSTIQEDLIKSHDTFSINDTALLQSPKAVKLRDKCKRRSSGSCVVEGAFACKQMIRSFAGSGEKLYDIAAFVVAARELGFFVGYLESRKPLNEFELLDQRRITETWGLFPQSWL